MIIRKYQEKDKKEVRELIENILKEIFKKEPRKLEDLDKINKVYSIFLVAAEKSQIVGTIGLVKKNNLGVLRRMFVKKEYRERGIAQRLYDKIEEFCKKSKIKIIILSTSRKMKEAIKFYEKNNFIQLKKKNKKLTFTKHLK